MQLTATAGKLTTATQIKNIQRRDALHLHAFIGSSRQVQQSRQTLTSVVAQAAKRPSKDIKDVKVMHKSEKAKWFAVVANAEFMLHDVNNESTAELLRERVRLYAEKDRPIDFFVVSEPAWLQRLFPEQCKRVAHPCVAIVGTADSNSWMQFVRIRLDRVMWLELPEMTVGEVTESLAPVPDFKPLPEVVEWTAPYAPYKQGWWTQYSPSS